MNTSKPNERWCRILLEKKEHFPNTKQKEHCGHHEDYMVLEFVVLDFEVYIVFSLAQYQKQIMTDDAILSKNLFYKLRKQSSFLFLFFNLTITGIEQNWNFNNSHNEKHLCKFWRFQG